VPNLGVIVFTHNSTYTIMRNEVFVYLEIYSYISRYLEIYSVYLEIYEYEKVVQGVRFPDGLSVSQSVISMNEKSKCEIHVCVCIACIQCVSQGRQRGSAERCKNGSLV
jgi:hypothetical protein